MVVREARFGVGGGDLGVETLLDPVALTEQGQRWTAGDRGVCGCDGNRYALVLGVRTIIGMTRVVFRAASASCG
jgi:hypothetical protein